MGLYAWTIGEIVSMNEAIIYKALGDPIRLEMVKKLVKSSPSTIGEISKNLGVTRQGARKQLQVLVSAQVVKLIPQGRETQVFLQTSSLKAAREFISQLEYEWDQRLVALKEFVESESKD